MAQEEGFLLGKTGIDQIGRIVREEAARLKNPQQHRGRWLDLTSPPGSGTPSIWFEIIESICADSYDDRHLIVLPTWATSGCTRSLPGEDEYDGTIAVYDVCNTFGYFTDAELPGKIGRATYMYPRSGYCTPRWIVDEICGETECTA